MTTWPVCGLVGPASMVSKPNWTVTPEGIGMTLRPLRRRCWANACSAVSFGAASYGAAAKVSPMFESIVTVSGTEAGRDGLPALRACRYARGLPQQCLQPLPLVLSASSAKRCMRSRRW